MKTDLFLVLAFPLGVLYPRGRGGTSLQLGKGKIMEKEERDTIAEWFANNWLLVAENDYDTYRSLLEQEGEDVVSISDTLSEEWEQLAEQVSELVEEKVSPIAGLFISQLLQGWGSYPFDLIARRVLEMKAEVSV